MAARTAVYQAPPAIDADIPWHYGDPHAEQRALTEPGTVVDLSNRGIATVTGADRLSWLNDLLTAKVDGAVPGDSFQALVLDPHGHVEHEVHGIVSSNQVWLITEGSKVQALCTYLNMMRFMRDVEVDDVSADFNVWWVSGTAIDVAPALGDPVAVWVPPGEYTGAGRTEN